MNVVWTPTDATRAPHEFAAPCVAEVSEGVREGHGAPAGLGGRPVLPLASVSCVPAEQAVSACSPPLDRVGHPDAIASGGGGGDASVLLVADPAGASPAAHDLTDAVGDLTEHGWAMASDHWELEPEGDE